MLYCNNKKLIVYLYKLKKIMLKMTIIGRLGADPKELEQKESKNGNVLLAFDVATEEKGETTWIGGTYFCSPKFVEYLKKGTVVYIEGEPSINQYENKDKVTQAKFSIRVTRLDLI